MTAVRNSFHRAKYNVRAYDENKIDFLDFLLC